MSNLPNIIIIMEHLVKTQTVHQSHRVCQLLSNKKKNLKQYAGCCHKKLH